MQLNKNFIFDNQKDDFHESIHDILDYFGYSGFDRSMVSNEYWKFLTDTVGFQTYKHDIAIIDHSTNSTICRKTVSTLHLTDYQSSFDDGVNISKINIGIDHKSNTIFIQSCVNITDEKLKKQYEPYFQQLSNSLKIFNIELNVEDLYDSITKTNQYYYFVNLPSEYKSNISCRVRLAFILIRDLHEYEFKKLNGNAVGSYSFIEGISELKNQINYANEKLKERYGDTFSLIETNLQNYSFHYKTVKDSLLFKLFPFIHCVINLVYHDRYYRASPKYKEDLIPFVPGKINNLFLCCEEIIKNKNYVIKNDVITLNESSYINFKIKKAIKKSIAIFCDDINVDFKFKIKRGLFMTTKQEISHFDINMLNSQQSIARLKLYNGISPDNFPTYFSKFVGSPKSFKNDLIDDKKFIFNTLKNKFLLEIKQLTRWCNDHNIYLNVFSYYNIFCLPIENDLLKQAERCVVYDKRFEDFIDRHNPTVNFESKLHKIVLLFLTLVTELLQDLIIMKY